MSCTGAVRSDGAHAARRGGGDRRDEHHRARRDARRRPRDRGRDGRPQARGLLLVDLLRLATAGSVDDGKSTLIGRLLYDAKAVLADQLAHVEERSVDGLDLALLTDGLRAEREQGITIDVAYRSFATPRRRFILADCPGHAQYTRNMVTGASTADLALLLVDARAGLTEQSAPPRGDRRAAADPARDRRRQQDGPRRLRRGALRRRRARGARARRRDRPARDRVHPDQRAATATTSSSARRTCPGTPARRCSSAWRRSRWSRPRVHGARLPIQLVLRGEGGARWAAGRLAAGALRPATRSSCCRRGTRTRVAEVRDADGAAEAGRRAAVGVGAARGRGRPRARRADRRRRRRARADARAHRDRLLARRSPRPPRRPLPAQARHAHRAGPARRVDGRIDFESLEWPAADELALNDIAHVRLRLGGEIAADAYEPLPRHRRVHPRRRVDATTPSPRAWSPSPRSLPPPATRSCARSSAPPSTWT